MEPREVQKENGAEEAFYALGGEKVSEPMEAALVRQDGEIAYPVREGIPQMLVEEGIGLGKLQ